MTDGLLSALPKSETLADQAYVRLREAIALGELAAGDRVTERGLAALLRVSPTPVREALRRLEQDGLIERAGPRTLRIAAISEATAGEVAEAEAALRGLIARFAARNATGKQLGELESIMDKADGIVDELGAGGWPENMSAITAAQEDQIRGLLRLLRTFNAVVEECAHNPVLMRMLDQARVFSPGEQVDATLGAMRAGTFRGSGRYAYHRRLIRALRARDAARAEELTLAHAAGVRDEFTLNSRRKSDSLLSRCRISVTGDAMPNQIGKRYVCATCGTQVLVTKPGDGALECHGEPMTIEKAKPLPASD